MGPGPNLSPMAAQATARRAPARRATARRTPRPAIRAVAPRASARTAPRAPTRFVPVAVGRTAVAVGGIADSGIVIRLTRSRGWIGVMAFLLVGIVALNVVALSFNSGSSKTAGISDKLRQENQALRAEITGGLSNERLQRVAARMGLVVPEPGAIAYLTPLPGDAALAASRLRRGAIEIAATAAPVAAPVVAATPVAVPTDTAPPAATATPEPVVAAEPTQTPATPVIATGGAVAP